MLWEGGINVSTPTESLPWVSIRAGKVSIRHAAEGPYPTLTPARGVELRVNGELQSKEIEVHEEDSIEITPVTQTQGGDWSVWVSPDRLTARLRLEPILTTKVSIPDHAPSARLQINPVEMVERSSPLDMAGLGRALRENRIQQGVDLSAYATLTNATEPRNVIIAEGIPATPGKDAEIEICFQEEMKALKEIAEDAEVDFRELFRFSSVEPGQVLVKRIAPVAGKPGIDVHGDGIMPPQFKDVELIPGEGVMVHEWASQLLAVKGGRPVLSSLKNGVRVDIMPDLPIPGNIDLSTGNIGFSGDVSVAGDITAGFTVHAGGRITVGGVVENAFLQSCGSVAVSGNIISSQVAAGLPPTFLKTAEPLLIQAQRDLEVLLLLVPQLKLRIPREQQLQLLPQLLAAFVGQKTPELGFALKTLRAELAKLPSRLLDVICGGAVGVIDDFLAELEQGFRSDASVAVVHKQVIELAEKLTSSEAARAYVLAKSVVSSNIITSGDITVFGGGCYNSRLQSGGKVTVHGVFRGGELRSAGDITVRQLGSESGVETLLFCPSYATVKIGKAYENSAVIIGARRHSFNSTQFGVTIRL